MVATTSISNGAPTAGNQVYSFPVLKASEIFACIREMQIPVSEEEIKKGDVMAVRKIFEVFIENIMGTTKEEMSQPAFSGLSALNYPELHEESIPELTFFRTSSKLMNACGVYDFCLKDILTPTPKRLRRQLSAMINFAKFREERLAAFSDLSNQAEDLLKNKLKLEEEHGALERELQELLAQRAAEEPAIQQLTEECTKLENEINVLNKRQAILRHETGELKAKNNELRDEVASNQFNILEAEKMVENLRGKIVNSPERVKKEISDLAISLDEAKEELNAMERRARELQIFSDTFSRAEKDTIKILEFMEEIEEDIKKCKDAKEKVKLQQKNIEENNFKTMECIAQRKRVEKLLEQKREQFDRYKEEASIKLQAADHALKTAKEELEQLTASHSISQQQMEENEAKKNNLQRELHEEEQKYQQELAEIQEMYSSLEDAIDQYNGQILQVVPTQT